MCKVGQCLKDACLFFDNQDDTHDEMVFATSPKRQMNGPCSRFWMVPDRNGLEPKKIGSS